MEENCMLIAKISGY